MKTTQNTILVTEGGTGIRRAFAEAFRAVGNSVIIAGRPKDVLDETAAAFPGMTAAVLDIENAALIKPFADGLPNRFPSRNVVIHCTGIMRAKTCWEELPALLLQSHRLLPICLGQFASISLSFSVFFTQFNEEMMVPR